jgi:hypothetical protein
LFAPLSLNDPFTLFLFIVATIMMVGYIIGRWANQRRAREISAWLEPGLRSLGGTPTVQHITHSAFRVQVTNARRPFQTITTSVVLISREVLPTWIWERLNKRTDLLAVHVTFRQPPAVEAEIVDASNELGKRGEMQAQEHNWPAKDLPSHWRLYYARETSLARLEGIAGRVMASPFRPWRVALRRGAPHLLLNMPMPELETVSSKQLTDMLIALSKLTQPPARKNGS